MGPVVKPSSVRNRLLLALLFGVSVVVAAIIGLRYVIVRPITCTPNCIGENLLGRDLQGLNLARTNFVEANLQGADLSAANLRQVDLSGANLANANLRNADLSEAQLIGTDLTGADLGGSRLSGANLTGAILDRADLTAVDLTEVALKGASFGEAKLTNARLNRANLNGIQFAKANLSGAILDEAGLSGANLSKADLSGASLRAVDLTGAWLNLTNLTGADLTGADLSGSRLIGAQLTSAILANARLQGAVVIAATLNGANVRGADLRRLRGGADQLMADDLRLDPVLAELNELQQNDLRQAVAMQGLAYDAFTQWEATLQPPEVVTADPGLTPAFGISTTASISATAGTLTETAGISTGPGLETSSAQRVKVNFYINSLRDAPDQPGSYALDFYVDSLWQETELTAAELTNAAAGSFFDPVLEVVNAGQVQELGRRYDRSIEPETNLRLRQRLTAIFTPPLDLSRFPFDQQVISLRLESAEYDSENLLLDFVGLVEPRAQSETIYSQPVPRGRYIDINGIDPAWQVQEIQVGQLIRVLPYDNSAWSQLRVDLVVKRVASGYLWRIWVVLAGLWLLVGSVLLVDSDALPIRLWLLCLLFWIVVAFQAILTRVLPPLDAFTLLDLYLLICYCAIVLMALLVLTIKLLHLWGRQRWARWVNLGSIILYPTVFVVVNLWLLTNAFR